MPSSQLPFFALSSFTFALISCSPSPSLPAFLLYTAGESSKGLEQDHESPTRPANAPTMPTIKERIEEMKGKPFYSFEYFPPKTPAGVANLYERVERMAKLEPMFVDITWGAGGTTSELTLELASNYQQQFNLETQMHLTCTNVTKEMVTDALIKARAAGIRNILCLRGDPPHGQEKWEATEGGFNNAVDLVRYVKQQHGDWFGCAVAGYPEGHIDWFKDGDKNEIAREDYLRDLQYLKDKVDAGADCIITQLFYDVDLFLQWVKDCREIGITVPIIPGIMPIGSYAGFFRMTGFCKTKIPDALRAGLEAVKDNEDAVKEFGVQVVTDMCKRLLAAGVPGLHIYTLNLEKSSIDILTNLGMLEGASERKSLPWRANIKGKTEDVRPIFWANRPRSYNQRTMHWDEYPNGRWGDSRSPAYGELTDYHLTQIHTGDENDNRAAYGAELSSVADVNKIFAQFLRSEIKRLPWCVELVTETHPIKFSLARICEAGLLTINSQPAVNGVSSSHAVHGWGGPGGVVYQKAYVEFFCSKTMLEGIKTAVKEYPSVQYAAVNAKGDFETSSKSKVTALTWGVFPDREILQPTVVDEASFLVWKHEAFGLWKQWQGLHAPGSASSKIIGEVADSYYLVNVVDNDFINGNIFTFLDCALAKAGK